MNDAARANALELSARLTRGSAPAVSEFRAALDRVPFVDRDAWVDLALGLDAIPDDGPELPRGGVPYLPCSVEALLRVVDEAPVAPHDVFVDVGSGAGRAMMFVHLLTGARAIGVEVQQALVHSARRAAERNHLARVSTVHGDASQLAALVDAGTVFFLYCPFSGERLEQTLQQLERFARRHPIRVCTVDLPLPQRPWLSPTSAVTESVVLYRAG